MSERRLARPEALRGMQLDRHAVIEASAGTGKTFTLEHLVVELVLGGATIDQILIVTFTEKATTELRLRVRSKLEELVADRGAPDGGGETGEWLTIDDQASSRLERALHGFDGATIATIHAFCQRVLRDNAFASGRLFEEQQVDGRDAFARVLRDVLRKDIATDPVRARWLETALAEGWTMTRLEDLLWKCLSARCELLPPFDVAANEALEAAIGALDTEALRVPSSPIALQRWGLPARKAHAIARHLCSLADVVDQARGGAPFTPRYVAAAKRATIAYVCEELRAASFDGSPLGRACSAALALARSTPSLTAAVAQTMLGPVREELSRRKRETGQFDFDDMLLLVDAALAGPRGDALRASMRDRWRYALVDEFQDTDETQWSILRRAFFEPHSRRSVLFLVGDPKQSIYRFRGADVDTYLRARGEILGTGGLPIPLLRSYRATPALVEATNALLDQGARQPFFTGPVEYSPVTCGRPERVLLDAEGRPVTPVHVLQLDGAIDLPRLGARIAFEILRIAGPEHPFRLDGRALTYSDIFVLTRKNDEARVVGGAFRAAGVPFVYYKEDGLFQSDEALEIRALLAAIDDPADRSCRASAWLTRFFDLPLADVDRARDLPASHPLVAHLARWKALAEARDFDRLFEAIVEDSGVLRREIFFGDGERELTNYVHIFEILLEHARQARVMLGDLVYLLSGLIDKTRLPLDIEGNLQRLESERRAVQIMTIHKAKGLEAPVVFLAGGLSPPRPDEPRVFHDGERRCAWIGNVPNEVKAKAAEEEREDEQRLMYVALTRAMGRLYVPSAMHDGDPVKVRGAYEIVHRRVCALVQEGHSLISVEAVTEAKVAPASAPANDTRLPTHAPPVHLLRATDDNRAYRALREKHAGFIATSYTRMRSGRNRARSRSAIPEIMRDHSDRRDEKSSEEALSSTIDTPLRSAKASGVFVHELLERVPLASFDEADFDSWRARADIAALVEEALWIHRVDSAQRTHAEHLVWRAYSTEIDLPGSGARIDGFARAFRVVREMDFVFPVPNRRAFARGSIDLAFEHDGRTYFVDWKTDSRTDYSTGALVRHVEEHYGEQVRLYTLATIKLIDVEDRAAYERRFGGLLYCFLRGMDERGAGVWSMRPTWDEVVSWSDWLSKHGAAPAGETP